jgi:hypothetical protein
MTAKIIPFPILLTVPAACSIHEFFAAAETAYEQLGPAVRQAWDREMQRLHEAEARRGQ